ncbi:MAG: F0F1 ATP synthase subunit delta [Gammaproteobacteria bacterium]|jgi:F-type H+-transporting ATPase subunit delta|nr:F0F1 ATP synthase subunit delta [Gammaproteobacteria bacterium]
MAEALTIARPYAQAAFLFASEHHVLKDWSDMLGLLAAIATDPEMVRLIESPELTVTRLADLFIGIGGERLNEKCHNFIRVLSEARRLQLLPEIAALFEIQRRTAEQTISAELITAFPATEAQQATVTAALKQRLGRDIELRCTTDAALLGGAVIRAGDLVIDGSVRGKLERLGTALSH